MSYRQFPIGDITEVHNNDLADRWFEDKEGFEFGRFTHYLQYASRPTSLDNAAVCDNHTAALELCRWWDAKRGDDRHYAVTGYMVGRAFQNESRFLPKFDTDLTHEIDEIRRDKNSRARYFGRAAWSCMEYCHPMVFAQHERLLEMSGNYFDLRADENREHFLAGLTLPYMLSSATRLLGYYKPEKNIVMKVDTIEDLQAAEFNQLFRTEG